MEDTIAGLRGQLADEMGLTEQQRARAEAAEAENTRLRAALEQIKQELGHVTQTPAQAAAAALAIARDALAASPNEDA
jgi:predicted phage gp36 major capsid-like protein